MNKLLKIIKKYWTRVWLVCVVLLLGGAFVTYAAYTEVSSVKRVVSTTSAPGALFSSNCMRTDISSRRLTSAEYTITVCNFDQEKPTTYNPSTISYTLKAEIQVKFKDQYMTMADLKTALNNDEEYSNYVAKAANYCIYKTEDDVNGEVSPLSINRFTSDKNFTVTFDIDTLESQKSSIDKYKVEIDKSDLENTNPEFFIHVWAEPNSPSNLNQIDTRLYGAKNVADTASWTGTFVETDCETVDYDFYNYVITGSGTGMIDILWKPDKFEINKFFFNTSLSGNLFEGNVSTVSADDTKYSTYSGWKKVTLKVDSTVKNRYELQLYKTLFGKSYTGDNAATKFIVCYFNKSETQG
ncbi:MAG: hypothetical protein PUG48_07340 [Clostridia bacterium]|nr:hypothetical protein [Clostridia bacterium]